MKKILAIALVLVMALGTVSFGYAAEYTPVEVNVNLTGETEILVGLDDADYDAEYSYVGSDYSNYYFDLKAVLSMEKVSAQLEKLAEENVEAAKTAKISGSFEITIELPDTVTLNDEYYSNAGFVVENGSFSSIYVMPEESDVKVEDNTITFTVALKDGLTGADLFTEKEGQVTDKLGDSIVLTCKEAIKPESTGDHEIGGSVTGSTLIENAEGTKGYNITYDFGTISDAVLTVETSGGSGGGGGSRPSYTIPSTTLTPSTPVSSYTVEYVLGTGTVSETELTDATVTSGTKITLPETAGTREGYVFDGWLVNGQSASGEITITGNTVITAKWINTTAAAGMNSEEHIVYIQGYPDGTVRPDATITRDEVATIFYRLLTEEKRAEIKAESSDFADAKGHWAEIAIATLSNGGYINGYEDGTFRPDNSITRAEFVTIAAKFAAETTSAKSGYTDIAGHWAEEAINIAANLGWITGYEDGTFRPDATITRAEVVKIVNRMLVRYADDESLIEGTVVFPDNTEDAWYYHDILEAANGHGHERRENSHIENWTELNESNGFEF